MRRRGRSRTTTTGRFGPRAEPVCSGETSRPGHAPEAVVLDLVNPIGAGQWLVGWGWETGLDEFGAGGKALRHRSN